MNDSEQPIKYRVVIEANAMQHSSRQPDPLQSIKALRSTALHGSTKRVVITDGSSNEVWRISDGGTFFDPDDQTLSVEQMAFVEVALFLGSVQRRIKATGILANIEVSENNGTWTPEEHH